MNITFTFKKMSLCNTVPTRSYTQVPTKFTQLRRVSLLKKLPLCQQRSWHTRPHNVFIFPLQIIWGGQGVENFPCSAARLCNKLINTHQLSVHCGYCHLTVLHLLWIQVLWHLFLVSALVCFFLPLKMQVTRNAITKSCDCDWPHKVLNTGPHKVYTDSKSLCSRNFLFVNNVHGIHVPTMYLYSHCKLFEGDRGWKTFPAQLQDYVTK